MTTKDEALKLALEALEEVNKLSVGENAICLPAEIDTAMDAIREALAEQPAQPIKQGWDVDTLLNKPKQPAQQPPTVAELLCVCGAEWEWRNRDWELVATPPTSKPWVGLTPEERLKFLNELLEYGTGFVAPLDAVLCNVEAKLREKNA